MCDFIFCWNLILKTKLGLNLINAKSKVVLEFGLKLDLKLNSSTWTQFKTEVKTELWF